MVLIAPLDIETLFINTFSGTYLIFIGVALLVISLFIAKFKLPIVAAGSIILLFSVMTLSIAPWLYILCVVIAGIGIGYTFTRIAKS